MRSVQDMGGGTAPPWLVEQLGIGASIQVAAPANGAALSLLVRLNTLPDSRSEAECRDCYSSNPNRFSEEHAQAACQPALLPLEAASCFVCGC
jgi:hypothetical protein